MKQSGCPSAEEACEMRALRVNMEQIEDKSHRIAPDNSFIHPCMCPQSEYGKICNIYPYTSILARYFVS
uniref:Uncharacterized protein n=1 Tax=Ascaris lumbricoides TaxID=6252 RepID=A0A0M3HVL6_ASCLU